MEIRKAFPPNIEQIKKRFPITILTVYAYGDVLYNPSGQKIPEDLMVHEETHSRQQKGLGVEQWWAMYLEKPAFRLEQEVQAYGEQYKYIRQNNSRQVRRAELQRLSKDLSSPLYGSIIKKNDAQELIENYA